MPSRTRLGFFVNTNVLSYMTAVFSVQLHCLLSAWLGLLTATGFAVVRTAKGRSENQLINPETGKK
jgi:hypothetical protein